MSDITEALDGANEELRHVVLERVEAVRAKDPAPLAARQAPDVITFDVLPPLHSRGNEAEAERTQAWFDIYISDIGYEVRDLDVAVDGDVGFLLVPLPRHRHPARRRRGRHVGPRHPGLPAHRRMLADHPRPRVGALRPRVRAGAPQPDPLNGRPGSAVACSRSR